MFDLRITGAEDLAAVSKRLKAAGESGKGLRRELFSSIQRSTKPIKQDVVENWRQKMPHRGGLSQRPLKLVTRTRTGGQRVGVRIVSASTDGYDLGRIDRGDLRHKVFGRWLPNTPTQHVIPGVITDPQEKAAPMVRDQIVRAISAINRKVEG